MPRPRHQQPPMQERPSMIWTVVDAYTASIDERNSDTAEVLS